MAGLWKGTREDKGEGVEEQTNKSNGGGSFGFKEGVEMDNGGVYIGASCRELWSTGKEGEEGDTEVDRVDAWELEAEMDGVS